MRKVGPAGLADSPDTEACRVKPLSGAFDQLTGLW